jgi:hypothetical protein
MRFSTIAALCTAPLALAGSPEAGLLARGALDIRKSPVAEAKDISVEVAASSSSTSVTEVIIIWINNGGGATTQTINTASVVSTATAAAVTHTVSGCSRFGSNLVLTQTSGRCWWNGRARLHA